MTIFVSATDSTKVVVGWITGNIIALIALAQPWIYWLWKKYARKGSIEIHETATVEIGYSGFGPTVALYGTLRAVNEDQFVRSIELVLTRTTDQQRRIFEWAALRPNGFQLNAQPEGKLELASGFMLLQSQPIKYNIFFASRESQKRINELIQRLREMFTTYCDNERSRGAIHGYTEQEFDQCWTRFSQGQNYLPIFTELDHLFDWQDAPYRLEINVKTANPDHTFSKATHFRMTPQDIQNLRVNSVRICHAACRGQLITPYHFAYCAYLPDQSGLVLAAHV